ncbi:MAG TPA: MmcQ/YjbR family DNA-binding protein [Polyangiaceae bacterium]
MTADEIYERVYRMALGFPGAEHKLSHGAPSFHVRGKMFLNFVDSHHGDGRVGVWCKATPGDQKRLVAQDPARFYVPPYVGVKGWVGVRLDQAKADWIELAILVEEAWASVAPNSVKRSGAAVARPAPPPPKRPSTDAKVAKVAVEKLSAICLALPETSCERSGSHATYYVRKKVFAYFLDNHHGDEIVAAAFKLPKGGNRKLAKADPKRFYLPQYMHGAGYVGMRLDTKKVDWSEVAERARESWLLSAPATLARTLGSGGLTGTARRRRS